MGTAIASAAAGAAIVSAFFIWLQVREMRRQTSLQRQVAQGAVEPYVWADIRVMPANGFFMEFALGNSGKTTASNVRVQIDPPLAAVDRESLDAVQAKLAKGLSSLAPGSLVTWRLGPAHKLVTAEGSLAHRVSISCDGPFGPVTPSEHVVDLADVRESAVNQVGTLHEIAERDNQGGRQAHRRRARAQLI